MWGWIPWVITSILSVWKIVDARHIRKATLLGDALIQAIEHAPLTRTDSKTLKNGAGAQALQRGVSKDLARRVDELGLKGGM